MSYKFFSIARLSSHTKGSLGSRYPRIERSAVAAIDKRPKNSKVLQSETTLGVQAGKSPQGLNQTEQSDRFPGGKGKRILPLDKA